ncbi:hypothetical protein AB685_20100 [Bacillus sp. LL01]|uniref:hypothetical protein n=1 Tax=Bacillus sp. LL01 TaxID=1665556 RepID=UPI00064CFA80|nr:hypothetical protein [Bacillus sp. LL01]KMJ56825.1 hypothetical protein AB685_20100 [Bacillus sp. LL01]
MKRMTSYRRLFFVAFMIMALLFTAELKTTFASSNIQALLTNWFEGQKQESINSLEEVIVNEKEVQMAILKQEIAVKLSNADKELADFSSQEAEKRKAELRSYTEELIRSVEFDIEGQQEQFMLEVERIMEETYLKLAEARQEAMEKKE